MKIQRSLIPICLFLVLSPILLGWSIDPGLFEGLRWRMIGPFRGGRTVAAVGIPDQPSVFFIGVNNGGVWKTDDYGRTWHPLFDDQPTGSIGALAPAASNPDTIYLGSGEGLQRPDLSVGDGVFKSTDGGKTWRHKGLGDVQQIADIVVDPRNEAVVLVAVLGHPYGPNPQRGVFKSVDGGDSWQKVLYVDENTGAVALSADPKDPDVLYADLWAARQGPWENASWQGDTSGLYKSSDGGETWSRLSGGLPSAEQGLGRIGIGISFSDPRRIFATVDAARGGGIYRSDDAGQSWQLVNEDRRLWGRGGDFAEIKVDPANKDVVYVANVAFYRSLDGGVTFTSTKGAPGGDDYHRIWINPLQPRIMLLAADQGATLTVNAGDSWSSWYNQPTAQLYHVSTDNQFPYFVYGGQQESGAIAVASRSNGGQISFREWHSVGSDEYAYVAPDPLNPDVVYGGRVMRFDRRTGQTQNVAPEAVRSGKYRILRTMPLLFSPLDPHALFFATSVLFKTRNGGQSWEIISPDLSREPAPLPQQMKIFERGDPANPPRRGVIYALAASPKDVKVIWAGTDDGLIHFTGDGGANWRNVTPPDLTPWSKIAQLEAGRFDSETAYAVVNRIRLDDMKPHIYRTHDGGVSWQEIVSGLPENGPVNAVREDPVRPGLLFAGTERAVYVSLNDGDQWLPLRLNMPATSIRDLVIHESDVVVGTHGRSIWILDDITPLRQMNEQTAAAAAHLFEPQTALRVRWNSYTDTPLPPEEPTGENPPDGAILDYYLKEPVSEVRLEILDSQGEVVRRFSSSDPPEEIDEQQYPHPAYWVRPPRHLSAEAGAHRFVWDLHYPPPPGTERSYPISAVYHNTPSGPLGPWVQPGRYSVRLTAGVHTQTQPLEVRLDPRVEISPSALKEQFELSMTAYQAYLKATREREKVETLRAGIQSRLESMDAGELKDALAALEQKAAGIEGEGRPDNPDMLYSSVYAAAEGKETLSGLQDRFLYMMALLQGADAQPTTQAKAALQDQLSSLEQHLKRWVELVEGDLVPLNTRLREAGLSALENVAGPHNRQ